MTTKCDGLPWSKALIQANLIVIFLAMGLSTFMLLIKFWILVVIYWVVWVLFFTVGRYVSCRHCQFHSKPCPSWCMGIIGGKLYKRSNKKHIFEGKGMLKMMFFDISFFVIAALFPIICYVFLILTVGLTPIDWVLLAIYGIIAVMAFVLHQKGCNKCPTKQCPLSKADKD